MVILDIDYGGNTSLLLERVESPYKPTRFQKRKIKPRKLHQRLWEILDEILFDRCYSAKDRRGRKLFARKNTRTKYVLKAEIREWIKHHLGGVVIIKIIQNRQIKRLVRISSTGCLVVGQRQRQSCKRRIKLFFKSDVDMIAFKLRWL